MTVILEGGCRVAGLRDGQALRQGPLRIWRHVGHDSGATAISLRVMECSPGIAPALPNADCDEVLYVLEGRATIFLDGRPHDVAADTGIYVRPGECLTIENPGPEPLMLVSSQCPDPGPDLSVGSTEPSRTVSTPRASGPATSPLVRLWEQQAEVTGDRWYRVLVDHKVGCERVTQFVGAIPPGRAPDHFHHYEEVLCILTGSGHMWAGRTSAPIQAGSCIFLPRGQVHCVENTGMEELRLLGVFYPAGSPADRYAAD